MPANDTKLSERIDAALKQAGAYSGMDAALLVHPDRRTAVIEGVLADYYVMPKQAGEGLEAGVAFIREQQAAEIERLRQCIRELVPCKCHLNARQSKRKATIRHCKRCKALEGGDGSE